MITVQSCTERESVLYWPNRSSSTDSNEDLKSQADVLSPLHLISWLGTGLRLLVNNIGPVEHGGQ